MQDQSTLIIKKQNGDAEALAVTSATLSIKDPIPNSPSEKDHGIRYELEVRVGNESGEDGAPNPFCTIPVAIAFGRALSVEELIGKKIENQADQAWDAWFGNDAPPITNNIMEFLDWDGSALHLRWTGDIQFNSDVESLNFDGLVTLKN